jgi:hypothetical protein
MPDIGVDNRAILNLTMRLEPLEDFGDIILLYLINLRGEKTRNARNKQQDALDR